MEYLKVFTDFEKVMEPLGDAERGRLFTAMLQYASRGIEPDFGGNERFIWPTAKLQIDRTATEYAQLIEKNRENGKKGGRPRKADGFFENPKNPAVFLETQKSQDKEKEKEKDKDKENFKKSFSPHNPPKKHKHGEYQNVLLTDEDLDKLKAEFPDWQQRIERLSAYIASTGKVYKNHLATIRNWAKRDAEKAAERPQSVCGHDTDNIFLQMMREEGLA